MYAKGIPVASSPYGLAANENPHSPLPAVQDLLATEAARVNRYPDRFATELIAALADRLSVPASHLAVGAGSVGVTQHLLHSLLVAAGPLQGRSPGGEIVYAWPSFEAYPHLTAMCGGRSVQVPLTDHRHDLEALTDAVTAETRAVIVCNPNNPTSTVVRRQELERFLDRLPAHTLVILDEAYREFVRDAEVPDGVELYRDRPQVVVLRTFSKAYGLAGLRVGYAVAHEPVAAAIRAAAVPFGVSSLAQSAAVASLDAEHQLMERVDTVVKERHRVREGLLAAGLEVPPSEANFLWLPLGRRTHGFAEACAAAGALVRAFPGEGARVTVGEPEANDIVLAVAAELARQN
ncbi:aminotransferase [Streptomyces pluripotens]|uniref:Aminotransferase n=1 Tax=Streptomyces pluripotens TaxID=1355015 RepID=A0A221P521_9ACTN|nr:MULTISPECIES: histidinol-phosphate transaminase [Streptomyces]ARP73039.1 aminotransferase [Streptomyces pluripotens]ASN27290.1 aminotransferase [Streptomyces pluripotens]MCH0557951.1 histidinol-phosphate transaminase [Streptomyces sp. MUM 16J]